MLMMMIIMMMMIMTIVSVEQRPGWGEQVQTIPTTYVVSTNISTMQRHNVIQNIPAYSSTTDLDDMILCICILVGGFNPSEKYYTLFHFIEEQVGSRATPLPHSEKY